MADGHTAAGSNFDELYNHMRESERTVDMVPALAYSSLLSGGKFYDAGYVSICDGSWVNFYGRKSVNIAVSEKR